MEKEAALCTCSKYPGCVFSWPWLDLYVIILRHCCWPCEILMCLTLLFAEHTMLVKMHPDNCGCVKIDCLRHQNGLSNMTMLNFIGACKYVYLEFYVVITRAI